MCRSHVVWLYVASIVDIYVSGIRGPADRPSGVFVHCMRCPCVLPGKMIHQAAQRCGNLSWLVKISDVAKPCVAWPPSFVDIIMLIEIGRSSIRLHVAAHQLCGYHYIGVGGDWCMIWLYVAAQLCGYHYVGLEQLDTALCGRPALWISLCWLRLEQLDTALCGRPALWISLCWLRLEQLDTALCGRPALWISLCWLRLDQLDTALCGCPLCGNLSDSFIQLYVAAPHVVHKLVLHGSMWPALYGHNRYGCSCDQSIWGATLS